MVIRSRGVGSDEFTVGLECVDGAALFLELANLSAPCLRGQAKRARRWIVSPLRVTPRPAVKFRRDRCGIAIRPGLIQPVSIRAKLRDIVCGFTVHASEVAEAFRKVSDDRLLDHERAEESGDIELAGKVCVRSGDAARENLPLLASRECMRPFPLLSGEPEERLSIHASHMDGGIDEPGATESEVKLVGPLNPDPGLRLPNDRKH